MAERGCPLYLRKRTSLRYDQRSELSGLRIVEFGIGDVPNFHHSGLDIDDNLVFAQHKSRMRLASLAALGRLGVCDERFLAVIKSRRTGGYVWIKGH